MAEKKKKRNKSAKKERVERRFLPEQTHTSRAAAAIGMVGSVALGAGVYAQWVQQSPASFAPALVAIGAFGLGGGLWLGSTGVFPVRVGDTGIAVERGAETDRVPWCDLQSVTIRNHQLTVQAKRASLQIPLGAHAKAASLIVQEAEARLPRIVDISDGQRKALPTVAKDDGEVVPLEGVQVAGSRCAKSDQVISFERDARLCDNCGQVYHKDSVPKQCVTCERALAGRALAP